MRAKTTRTIGMLGFDEANALDVTGPLESVLERERSRAPSRREHEPYELELIGLRRVLFSAERACLSVPPPLRRDVRAILPGIARPCAAEEDAERGVSRRREQGA